MELGPSTVTLHEMSLCKRDKNGNSTLVVGWVVPFFKVVVICGDNDGHAFNANHATHGTSDPGSVCGSNGKFANWESVLEKNVKLYCSFRSSKGTSIFSFGRR